MAQRAEDGSRQRWLATLFVCVFLVLMLDPIGVSTGLYDSNPYRAITARLQHANDGKVIFLASYDDFYNLSINDWLRSQVGEGFVERGFDEVLSAASLGDKVFNQYLQHNNVKYVIVPMTTVQRGRVFYKFGDHGSIDIDLPSPFFKELEQSGGDYPVALYQVETAGLDEANGEPPNYYIAWTGVPDSFHKETRQVLNNNFISKRSYRAFYEDGEEVSWVFDGERVAFAVKSLAPSTQIFSLELVLAAAYGPTAPIQVVGVESNSGTQIATLRAGHPVTVRIKARTDDLIEITNFLSCKSPAVFDPYGGDGRKFCYGVTDLRVRLEE